MQFYEQQLFRAYMDHYDRYLKDVLGFKGNHPGQTNKFIKSEL
mgnify:FL=1